MNKPPSSFKNKLSWMQMGDKIFAGQLAGDFTLPRDKAKKLVFMAGGIGVTPFRSMVKFLIDSGEKRDAVLLYAVKAEEEIAYRHLFIEAEAKIGLKTEYVVGKFIDEGLVKDKIQDWQERIFYISGPDAMVRSYKKMLIKMGVSRLHIVTDYFPGFA
jgi:ferredoxin-NADP reductase